METQSSNTADQDLKTVLAVRQGDPERYRDLVERHERRVFAVAWSSLGDAALAEDAAQEAFVRAYQRLWLLGDGAKFAAWITAITRRVAINFGLRHRREMNRRTRWALEQTPPETEDSAELCPPETLRQALAELPPAHRECLVLFYLEGRSGAETAAALGISEAALRVRLHRARAAMREILEQRLEGSLAKLGPSKTLAPNVMSAVLATSSAKSAAGGSLAVGLGAKILSTLGKSILFSWLLPVVFLVSALPSIGIAWLLERSDRKNYRDAAGFRPKIYRHFLRSFAWGYPLVFVLTAIIFTCVTSWWGFKGAQLFTVALLVGLTAVSARSIFFFRNPQGINAFVYCCILTFGTIAFTLFGAPPTLAMLPWLLGGIWFYFTGFKYRPAAARMDYNLFLRAAEGMLKMPDDEGEFQTAPKQFDRHSLRAFARFLGERYVAVNFRWETRGLVLRLPPVKPSFLANLTSVFLPAISRDCSHILLDWDGNVFAHCGDSDAAALVALHPGRIKDQREMELFVGEAAGHAWQEFRGGRTSAAEHTLGMTADADVFIAPPSRAKSTRWLRHLFGLALLAATAGMTVAFLLPHKTYSSSYNLKPVQLTTNEVRFALDRKARFTKFEEATNIGDNLAPYRNLVLAPTNLMDAATMDKLRGLVTMNLKLGEINSSNRVDTFLGTPVLESAFLNDWFTKDQLGITDQLVRETLTNATKRVKALWFELAPMKTMKWEARINGPPQLKPAGYTVLDAEPLALRTLSLDKFGCIDAIEDRSAAGTLIRHQILTAQTPPGRRPLPDATRLHGLFFTEGFDPIFETYEALIVVEKLGRMDQIDRNACIEGILRFHRGAGLFTSENKVDGLVISGSAEDTLAGFKSLRMLGALDRVKDLDKWKFRPNFTSKPATEKQPRVATWDEIEAWVCAQRLDRDLAEHNQNPAAPWRSLLEPQP